MLYRLSRAFYVRGWRRLARAVKAVNFIVFHAILPPEAAIGRVILEHSGLGLVIHPNTTIGDGVRLFHHVTLATDNPLASDERMVIERGVTIYPHSIVIGPRHIGRDAVIGAGSVVTKDVPAGAIVFGNPARVHSVHDVS